MRQDYEFVAKIEKLRADSIQGILEHIVDIASELAKTVVRLNPNRDLLTPDALKALEECETLGLLRSDSGTDFRS